MLRYPELNNTSEPGFGLDYLRECQPLAQIIGIRWLDARINGALDAIKAVNAQDNPKATAIRAIAESHWRRVSESWEWATAFGILAAREAGEQWASDLQSNEGCNLERAEHIVSSAITLAKNGHAPENILLGLETIARMHAHHDREAAMIIDTAKALDLVLPGHKIDEHWVSCYGADTYEANALASQISDCAETLSAYPTAHKALIHWNEMRLHEDALALGAQLGTPTGATQVRRANGGLRYMESRDTFNLALGNSPVRTIRSQTAQGIGALLPMVAPDAKDIAKSVGIYNAMLERAHEAFPAGLH